MKVLLSKGVTEPRGKQLDVTWPEFKDLIRSFNRTKLDESDEAKRDGTWFSASEYRGGHRRREKIVGKVGAVVADLDGVRDPEKVKKALSKYEYIAWDTWNSTEKNPRWRVVIPVEGGVPPEEFPKVVSRILEPLNGYAKIDPRSLTPEQLWFTPQHKRSQREHHRIWENHGEWIKPPKTTGQVIHVDFTGVTNVHRPESVQAGDRNNSLVKRLTLQDALLCESRDDLEEIAMEWNSRLKEPLGRREVLGVVRKTWNWMQRGEGVSKRAEAWRVKAAEVEVGTLGVGMMDRINTAARLPDSLIGDFLYPGATMLSAKMKEGKSYLAMQMAWSVAEGVPFLAGPGHAGFPVKKRAKAVVLALEDTPGGINKRFHGNIASGVMPKPGGTAGDNIRLVYMEDLEKLRSEVPRRIDGLILFEKMVQEWYNRGYRLICIDPLAALAAGLGIVDYPGCHRGMNAHARDFQTMRYFTSLAQRFDNLCIVISMHHGKSKHGHSEQDPGDMIAGTTGFGAGAITTLSLLPVPGILEADDEDDEGRVTKRRELYIHGRYTPVQHVLVEQNKATGLWQALGRVSDRLVTTAREEYFRAIIDLGGDETAVSAEEIRKATGGKVRVDAIHKVLKRSMARGVVCFDRRVYSKKGPGGGYRTRLVGEGKRGWLLKNDGSRAGNDG